jgi:hypothetical protein
MSSRTNRAILALAFAAAVGTATAVTSSLNRAKLRSAELAGDTRFQTLIEDDPSTLLGGTRAVYLPGYGLVFSAELDLAPRYTPNPFRPSFTKEEIARIHQLKKDRLTTLRTQMRGMLVSWASNMEIPGNENLALSVTIPYSKVENSEGLPKQIVMSADRASLRSSDPGTQIASIKVQEYF